MPQTRPKKKQSTRAATAAAQQQQGSSSDTESSLEVVRRPISNKSKKKRGRPTNRSITIQQLAKNKSTKMCIRFGFLEKHPQAKEPKDWPKHERNYVLCWLDEPLTEYELLITTIKAVISDQRPQYVPIEDDTAAVFVHTGGSSTLESLPCVDDKLKKKKSFTPITGDVTLGEAVKRLSSLVEIEVNEDSSSEEDYGQSTKKSASEEALLLDVVVWVVSKTSKGTAVPSSATASNTNQNKRKKGQYDEVLFEIMPMVISQGDEAYKTTSLEPIGKFFVDAAFLKPKHIGEVRELVAAHIESEKLKGYIDEGSTKNYGLRSQLFFLKNHGSKTATPLSSKTDLADALKSRANRSGAVVQGDTKKYIALRVALGKKNQDDTEYKTSSKREQIRESLDPDSSYYSPGKQTPVSKRTKRAATSEPDPKVEEWIHVLYTDVDSPYWHGFTRELAARIRTRWALPNYREEINESMEADDTWPTPELLFGTMFGGLLPPRRGAYPPLPGSDKPPPQPKQQQSTPLDKLASSMEIIATASASTNKNHQVDYARCLFRFRKGDGEHADVMVKSDLLDKKPEFTGGDLLKAAERSANAASAPVFNFNAEQRASIAAKTAKMFVRMANDGPKWDGRSFVSLRKDDLLPFFVDGITTIEFLISVEDNVVQEPQSIAGLF